MRLNDDAADQLYDCETIDGRKYMVRGRDIQEMILWNGSPCRFCTHDNYYSSGACAGCEKDKVTGIGSHFEPDFPVMLKRDAIHIDALIY